jgi:putative transposase
MDLGDRATEFGFLLRARAGQFTPSFNAVPADVGIHVVKIPPRCPRANCFTERFLLTATTELTHRMLIFGLRTILTTYSRHDNGRRPHRSRQLRPPRPDHPVSDRNDKQITRRPVLGGLINE